MAASSSRKRVGAPPASAQGHKRRQLDLKAITARAEALNASSTSHSADPLALVRVETTSTVVLQAAPSQSSALDQLRQESHDMAQEVAEQQMNDSQTGKTYQRRWNSYIEWWEGFSKERHARDPAHPVIPALPVTAAKVVHFLQSERTRSRKRGRAPDGSQQYQEGTSIGKSSVSQIITALEYLRASTQHRFPNDLEARTKLRDVDDIHKIERASKHDEPKRMEKSQTLKAAGTSQDTYQPEELVRLSLYCLTSPTTKYQAEILVRDRAMLLLACATAFRGANIRTIQLSDLFMQSLPNVDAGPEKRIEALTIFSDNAKHNQLGRVDEQGALRHRLPELCAIGALAMYLFTLWHVREQPLPPFVPDFSQEASSAGYGHYGRREWYSYLLFPGGKGPCEEMSFDNHSERIKLLHKHNDINIAKVTHAARPFTAQTTRQHGASQADAKALGGWQDQGSYRAVYDRLLPLPGLVGAAMFKARQPGEYFVPRSCLDPPADVLAQIFPWVEGELAAHSIRTAENPRARDIALTKFLQLLQWLRVVLAQDLAVLWSKAPQFFLFNYAPFNSDSFRAFANGTDARLRDAEQRISDGLSRLPEVWQSSIRTLWAEEAVRNEQFRAGVLSHLERLDIAPTASTSRSPSHPAHDPRAFVPPDLRQPIPSRPSSRSALPSLPPSFVVPLPPWAIPASPGRSVQPLVAASTTPFPGTSRSSQHPLAPSQSACGSEFHIAACSGADLGSMAVFPSSPDSGQWSPPPAAGPAIPVHATMPPVISASPSYHHQLPSSAAHIQLAPAAFVLQPPSTVVSAPPVPVLAIPDDPMDSQWTKLLVAFPAQKLNRYTSAGRWLRHNGVLIPDYRFPKSGTPRDCWLEWTVGLNGDFSLRELDTHFGSAWRENDGKKKTPYGKRKVVAELIEQIATQRPNWTPDLALRFLDAKYGKHTARTLHDFVQKREQRAQLLREAMAWPVGS